MTLQMQKPWKNESSQMRTGHAGTQPQDDDYYTSDPALLTNKAPWSTPLPVSYGRSNQPVTGWTPEFPHGYVAGWHSPQLLPDSPPRYRQRGEYRGRGTSRLVTGGDHEIEAGGSGQLSNPTDAECLKQAHVLYEQMRQKAD